MTKRLICPICHSKRYQVIYRSTFRQKHLSPEVFSARRVPDMVHGTIVVCQDCKLYRTLEIVSPRRLSNLYRNSSFTYTNLVENLRTNYRKLVEAALSYIPSRSTFLEIGCGNGFLLEEAKKMKFKNVLGIEPSKNAVGLADKTIRKSIKVSLLNDNLFPKSSLELIVAFQVFDHIPDPNKFLKTCHQLLKRKGVLMLMNHDVESLPVKILGEKSPIFDIEHTYLYSKNTISRILENNHFKLIKIYNPSAIFSLKYLFRLLPLPQSIKRLIISSNLPLLNINLTLFPGNLCVIVRKN